MRDYCRLNLPKEKAEAFMEYLRKKGIEFEPSECYDTIHIECLMTDEEMIESNRWIDENL